MRSLTNDTHMLGMLALAESKLVSELRSQCAGWNTLRVDDEFPHVDRLWQPLGAFPGPSGELVPYRLYLHKISPNPSRRDSLWHRHRWPSAVRVWTPTNPETLNRGGYIHRRGMSALLTRGVFGPDHLDPTYSAGIVRDGDTYTMTDPDEYHSVQILGEPVYSVMVVGPLYDSGTAQPEREKRKPLGPVPDRDAEDMLDVFRKLYHVRPSW